MTVNENQGAVKARKIWGIGRRKGRKSNRTYYGECRKETQKFKNGREVEREKK